tara:strand:+ start:2192 stop:3283 length:1092 start_codon:yes stop_codon:yes gene_type:complete
VKKIKIKKPKLTKKLPRIKRKNQAPGTLVYTGEKEGQDLHIEVIDYKPDFYNSFSTKEIEEAFNKKGTGTITWINVNGLNNIDAIEQLGKHYNLHPLILEDIVDTGQRPKIDEYQDYVFVVLRMLYHNPQGDFVSEHVSMVMGEDYVLTFQESDGDVFDSVRQRLSTAKGRIRQRGADYLLFALMDAVVDEYFTIADDLGEKIEDFEDRLFVNKNDEDITQEIQSIKKEILRIRKAVSPLRDIVSRMENTASTLFEESTKTYIHDLADHIIHVSENVELYREMSRGLMDMYMTTISNKMNEVMKVLTIMASIFIPLTFMAGIYGMNFDYIPELHLKYGYFYLWGAMILVFLMLLYYFKRKKWL